MNEHYKKQELECIDIVNIMTSNLKGNDAFIVGNMIKYIYRMNYKGQKESDLIKIIDYSMMLLGFETEDRELITESIKEFKEQDNE